MASTDTTPFLYREFYLFARRNQGFLFTRRNKDALDGYVAIHPFCWNGIGAILGDIRLLERFYLVAVGDGEIAVGEAWGRYHLYLECFAVCHLVVVEGGSVGGCHHTVAVGLGNGYEVAVSLLLRSTFCLQQGDARGVGQVDIDIIDIHHGILLHLVR